MSAWLNSAALLVAIIISESEVSSISVKTIKIKQIIQILNVSPSVEYPKYNSIES